MTSSAAFMNIDSFAHIKQHNKNFDKLVHNQQEFKTPVRDMSTISNLSNSRYIASSKMIRNKSTSSISTSRNFMSFKSQGFGKVKEEEGQKKTSLELYNLKTVLKEDLSLLKSKFGSINDIINKEFEYLKDQVDSIMKQKKILEEDADFNVSVDDTRLSLESLDSLFALCHELQVIKVILEGNNIK